MDALKGTTYFVLMLIASTHTYWSLPIAEHKRTHIAMYLMFRLEFLGDFDLEEMEGCSGKGANSTKEWACKHYHLGFHVLFVICSFFFTILAMNVYIAVLCDQYDECKKRALQQYSIFRARSMTPHFLRRKFWIDAVGIDC